MPPHSAPEHPQLNRCLTVPRSPFCHDKPHVTGLDRTGFVGKHGPEGSNLFGRGGNRRHQHVPVDFFGAERRRQTAHEPHLALIAGQQIAPVDDCIATACRIVS